MSGGTNDVGPRGAAARRGFGGGRSARLGVALLLLALGAGGCAYFNTFHHAKQAYAKAQRLQARSKSDKLSPEAAKCYDEAIEKSAKVIVEHGGGWRASVDDALFLMGASYYGKRDDESAIKKFRELVLNYPHSKHVPEALFYTGLCYVRMRNDAAAERTFARVLREYPDFERRDEILFATAQSLEMAGQTAGALGRYHELLRAYKGSPKREDALRRVGEIHFDAGRYDSSLAAYEALADMTRDDDRYFDSQLRAGTCWVRMGAPDRALDVYRRIISDEADNNENAGRVWLAMAEAQNRAGRHEEALQLLNRVVEHFERRGPGIEAAYSIGYTHENYLHDYAKAREYYTQVNGAAGPSVFKDQAERRLKNLGYLEELQNIQDTADAADADRARRADAALKVAEFTLFEGRDSQTALTQYAAVENEFSGTEAAVRATYARALVLRGLDSLGAASDALVQVVKKYPASTQAERSIDMLAEEGGRSDALMDSLRAIVRSAQATKARADSLAAATQAAADAARADSIAAAAQAAGAPVEETAGEATAPAGPGGEPALIDASKATRAPEPGFVPITVDSVKAADYADSLARFYRGALEREESLGAAADTSAGEREIAGADSSDAAPADSIDAAPADSSDAAPADSAPGDSSAVAPPDSSGAPEGQAR